MAYFDLHTHSNLCDGKDSCEQMVLSAINKGISVFGIVVHSYVEFDKEYCISEENQIRFLQEMNRLKEKYKNDITLYAGLEEDFYTTSAIEGYDYKIGSLHYFKIRDKYYSLDISIPGFIEMVNTEFGGDYLAVCEKYYELLSGVIEKTNADIIAHVDLITKFNENDKLFDTSSQRYVDAYRSCIDKLILTGKPFEINTGAISRGYRSAPYPAPDVYDYIKSKGGKFILSSDSHSAENIAFLFDSYAQLL